MEKVWNKLIGFGGNLEYHCNFGPLSVHGKVLEWLLSLFETSWFVSCRLLGIRLDWSIHCIF